MNRPDADSNLRTYEQVSAGGVVYRGDGVVQIVIILTASEMRWQLPKGVIDRGETAEQAAVREVREETGIEAELIAQIDTTEYWFSAMRNGERRRFHKFVHFYLMEHKSGDVRDHDHEVKEARWVTIDQALGMLDFKNERDVVTKAVAMIDAQEPN